MQPHPFALPLTEKSLGRVALTVFQSLYSGTSQYFWDMRTWGAQCVTPLSVKVQGPEFESSASMSKQGMAAWPVGTALLEALLVDPRTASLANNISSGRVKWETLPQGNKVKSNKGRHHTFSTGSVPHTCIHNRQTHNTTYTSHTYTCPPPNHKKTNRLSQTL